MDFFWGGTVIILRFSSQLLKPCKAPNQHFFTNIFLAPNSGVCFVLMLLNITVEFDTADQDFTID